MAQSNESTNARELPMEPTIPSVSLKKFTGGNHLEIDDIPMNFTKEHTLLEEVYNFWEQGGQPDLRVRIGDEEFKCHRLLLAVHTDVVQLAKESNVLNLPADSISAVGFQCIYHWILTGKMEFERSEIVEMLVAAKYLKIEELVQLAWFMLDQVELYNEDQAFLIAHKCQKLGGLMHIDTLMMQRIKCFFLTLVSTIEFINLPFRNLYALLDSDEIAVNNEKEVFFAAVRWLTHDWPTRREHVSKVLKTIRLTLLPEKFIKQLQTPQVYDDPEMNLICQLPDLDDPILEAGFAKILMHSSDGSQVFDQLYKIFNLDLSMPRKFIYHSLASYHKEDPNEPQDEFQYKDFLRYLSILQKLEPYTWRKLEPRDIQGYQPC